MMQTFSFDVKKSLYNVIIVWHTPCAGIPKRDSKQANVDPLEWEAAKKWCRDILHGIGRDWQESKFCDIYIEPVACPRPWTPEIYAAFKREMRRATIEEPCRRQQIAVQETAYLRLQLAHTRAITGGSAAA